MANETIVTVVGNTTADADLRYTQGGKAVANFTVASTPRVYNRQTNTWEDGDALFLRCSVWGDYAENVAASIFKGTRVIVQGRLKQRSYEKDGQKRTVVELEVDEIGASLRYAQAAIQRVHRDHGSNQQPSSYQQELEDAWATPQQAAAAGVPAAPSQAAFDEPWATPSSANIYDDGSPF